MKTSEDQKVQKQGEDEEDIQLIETTEDTIDESYHNNNINNYC